MLRWLVFARRKLSGLVCCPERGDSSLVARVREGGVRESCVGRRQAKAGVLLARFGRKDVPELQRRQNACAMCTRNCCGCLEGDVVVFRYWCPFVPLLVVFCFFFYAVILFCFVTHLPRGAHDPSFLFYCLVFASLSLGPLCREGGFRERERRHSILVALLFDNTFFVSYIIYIAVVLV